MGDVVRTPLGFADLDLNPQLGSTTRVVDSDYEVTLTDRTIVLVSTDANTYTLTLPATGIPNQVIDIYMPDKPTGGGDFITANLSGGNQYTFDRPRHIQAIFSSTTNTWDLMDASFAHTFHFETQNVGGFSLGVVGTPTPAALANFGQIGVRTLSRIAVIHLHLIEDGTGGTGTFEIYRRRSGVFTQLGTLTYTAPTADFVQVGLVPATDDLKTVMPNDYLFCQATAVTLFSVGNANGLTVDFHFEDLPRP